MEAKISRRGFIGGAAAMAGSVAINAPLVGSRGGDGGLGASRPTSDGSLGASRPARRWYKGNLHTHTFWSDGKAFPEEAVAWYKSRGYNFLGLSDHNVFQSDADRWVGVLADGEKNFTPDWAKGLPHRYCWNVPKKYFDAYAAAYPGAAVRKGAGGRTEARLSTFAELAARFDAPGEFLLVPDVEATRSAEYSDGRYLQLHMNYVNLPALPPSYLDPAWKREVKDEPFSGFLAGQRQEVSALAASLARPHLFILNHPIWTWYDVGPEALIDNPEVRFFEVCNNGSPFDPGEGLPADGLDTDRLWDVVNAFRVRRGQPLLYGIGTDDTHHYRGEPGKMLMPGNAWTLVRAESLDAASLIAAMEAGDFAACEGVEPEDVSFDRTAGRLTVSVAAKAGAARTIRFIVSKRGFPEAPVRTAVVRPAKHKGTMRFERTINVYDEGKIGVVAKTVEGKAGEPLSASYELADDDLYVRARIEERGATRCTAPLHPQGLLCAWTQPYTATASAAV